MNHWPNHTDRLHHFLSYFFHHILQSGLEYQQVNPFLHYVGEQVDLKSFSIHWSVGCKALQFWVQWQFLNRCRCSRLRLKHLARKKRKKLFFWGNWCVFKKIFFFWWKKKLFYTIYPYKRSVQKANRKIPFFIIDLFYVFLQSLIYFFWLDSLY